MLKRDRNYDPAADKESRIDELRVLYESSLIAKEDEAHYDVDHVFVSADVAAFFDKESFEGRVDLQAQKERKLKRNAPVVVHESLLAKELK